MNKKIASVEYKGHFDLSILEKKIGYCFREPKLLESALTHPSMQCSVNTGNYERLEFLGDSVLGLVVAEILFNVFSNDDEGLLTKKKIALVRGRSLVSVAQDIDLGNMVRMSQGEEDCGGRLSARNLENALEALIGAIYLDGGLEAAEKFVTRHWKTLADNISELQLVDPKTSLQEWAQSRNLPIPTYRVVNKTGLEHCPVFTVEVQLANYGVVSASGNNKKDAELAAARLLLEKLPHECGRKS